MTIVSHRKGYHNCLNATSEGYLCSYWFSQFRADTQQSIPGVSTARGDALDLVNVLEAPRSSLPQEPCFTNPYCKKLYMKCRDGGRDPQIHNDFQRPVQIYGPKRGFYNQRGKDNTHLKTFSSSYFN